MKKIDERELQKRKQQKKNKQRQKGARGTDAIVKICDLLSFLICYSILVLK